MVEGEGVIERRLLIVDDGDPFRSRLAHVMRQRGFDIVTAAGVEDACALARKERLDYAVVDLKKPDGSRLDVVVRMRFKQPDLRNITLTGYGNMATSDSAVKVGAVKYLAKPTDTDEFERALMAHDGPLPAPPDNPMSAYLVR